ncbi:MAG: peptidoglycan-binding domain-containing protein [Pseudomonadota bacterium]
MLKSPLLSGSPRLEQAASGPPSIRKRPPDDNNDAVQRIQKALVELGFNLPNSFKQGPNAPPDGLYGPETEGAVRDFQKREFPTKASEWDGRCGPNTLGKMDDQLADNSQPGTIECVPAGRGSSASYCLVTAPSPVPIPYPTVGTPKPKRARISPARTLMKRI